LFACVVLRQSHSVGLTTPETGVEPLTQHTDREYGTVAVDSCHHFRSLLFLITRHTFLAIYCCCRQGLSSSWRTAPGPNLLALVSRSSGLGPKRCGL